MKQSLAEFLVGGYVGVKHQYNFELNGIEYFFLFTPVSFRIFKESGIYFLKRHYTKKGESSNNKLIKNLTNGLENKLKNLNSEQREGLADSIYPRTGIYKKFVSEGIKGFSSTTLGYISGNLLAKGTKTLLSYF